MSRARRLEPIREIAHGAERTVAIRVANIERRLADAQQREQDLRRYRREYQDSYAARAGTGLQARQLREYQTFLSRLGAAVEAQQATVAQLRQEAEQERARLRNAMARRKALGIVIERAQREERAMDEKRMQRELDEHALRRAPVIL
jgi:flagellar FliJ protein